MVRTSGSYHGVIALGIGGAASPTAGFANAQTAPLTAQALAHAQTAITAFLVFSGLLLVIFVEPPAPWWTGGDRLSGDRRPTIVAASLAAVFVIVESVAPLRDLFAMAPLALVEWGLVSAAIFLWLPLLRWLWRSESITRYLGIRPLDDASRNAQHHDITGEVLSERIPRKGSSNVLTVRGFGLVFLTLMVRSG